MGVLDQQGVRITSLISDFLVIIDSMVNLGLLHTGQAELTQAATAHARTILRTNLRRKATRNRAGYAGPLFGTFHVANLDPQSGDLKEQCKAQGYTQDSRHGREGRREGFSDMRRRLDRRARATFSRRRVGWPSISYCGLKCHRTVLNSSLGTARRVSVMFCCGTFDAPVDEEIPCGTCRRASLRQMACWPCRKILRRPGSTI
ncbi:hypothetical protein CONLIGDRAFT_706301 [Coniochaeta ligniaria NRRL 30616]|uniref:Uncharacterized protein n=1 Tax=Coniochaeta ligniaria NRRL 30616 TaxID=1408157 RepID=A0A1J7IFL3_9PEZI|nr:hypothetical protein CONLIGDRAFT_706301 [Coniochaeta ligniaria NRRL 30616]